MSQPQSNQSDQPNQKNDGPSKPIIADDKTAKGEPADDSAAKPSDSPKNVQP